MNEALAHAVRHAREHRLGMLDEPAGKKVLDAAGVRVPRNAVVAAGGDIRAAAASLTPPLVLKVVATNVVHKSDVGGVRLHLRDVDEVATAAAELLDALRAKGIEPQGWLIEEMAPRGIEVVVGGNLDAEFGPMVMVGLGGIFVEVLKDVAFRLCPIDANDAREMIDELRGAPLLHGARGSDPVSVDALVDVLLRVGGAGGLLMAGGAELAELDINPLIVSRHAAVAVDARFILQHCD